MSNTDLVYQNLKESVFKIESEVDFQRMALQVFEFQYNHIPLYRNWVDHLGIDPEQVAELHQIPFLPIRFFKEHRIKPDNKDSQIVFSSSGTTGMEKSQHWVVDLDLYNKSYELGFEFFYGPISQYVIIALLPSYMERNGSSLIYMAEDFIEKSAFPESGFYLDDYEALMKQLQKLKKEGKKVILLGVSFALLDLAENFSMDFPSLIIMETGGMKGRRKEMVREEIHQKYKQAFGVHEIHSEYGMTELLSQSYSHGEGIFQTPPWMRILIRDINDPLTLLSESSTGGINVIDLANLNSCAFIATQDIGKTLKNGGFEVLGRFDHSDVRGCNLLVL